MWIYLVTEPGLWTVGFYAPNGSWHPVYDFNDQEEADAKVNYLNGGEAK